MINQRPLSVDELPIMAVNDETNAVVLLIKGGNRQHMDVVVLKHGSRPLNGINGDAWVTRHSRTIENYHRFVGEITITPKETEK